MRLMRITKKSKTSSCSNRKRKNNEREQSDSSYSTRTRRSSQVIKLILILLVLVLVLNHVFKTHLHEYYYFPIVFKEEESSKRTTTTTSTDTKSSSSTTIDDNNTNTTLVASTGVDDGGNANDANVEVVLNEIEKFNNELFCPVNPKQSLKPENMNLMKLVEDIYRLQHPVNCLAPSNKYWIVDHPCNAGMFATLDCWEYYFTKAMSMNRTFLWTNHGGMTGFTSQELCPSNKSGYECFFLPVSHCNPDEVIAHYNASNSYFHYSPKGPRQKPNISSSDSNSEHVWFVDKGWHWHRATSDERNVVANRYTNVTFQDYRAIVNSFFLRMQPFLREKVDITVKQILLNKVGKANNNDNNNEISSETTISMAIRWGDKCAEWDERKPDIRYTPIEMQCYNATEYMEIAKTIQQLKPSINAVIATSESKSIINTILADEDFNQKFTVIVNDKDVMQGASLLNKGWADKSTEHDQALETMVSILSSIRIHFYAKYYFAVYRSNWIGGIQRLARYSTCIPFVESYDTDTNSDGEEDVYELTHYNDINRGECIQLKKEENEVVLNPELYDQLYKSKSIPMPKYNTNIFNLTDRHVCNK